MSGTDQIVAAFDVDGTLTVRDCVRPFLERLGGRRSLAVAAGRRPIDTSVGLARRDRDRIKDVIVGGVYRGRTVDEVDEQGRMFAQTIMSSLLRSDTLARLRWHQDAGHRTVLVSASLRAYLDPLAESLGIERALCTDVAVVEGRYVDRLQGNNCRGPEKLVRLRAWLAATGLGEATIWAYGDSAGDREMLAVAHHPVWVKGTTVPAVPTGELI